MARDPIRPEPPHSIDRRSFVRVVGGVGVAGLAGGSAAAPMARAAQAGQGQAAPLATGTTDEPLAAVEAALVIATQEILKARGLLGKLARPDTRPVITDRELRPLPALPAIEVGQVITDPTFGSRILRITGPDSGDEVVSYRSSDSTMQRSWNAAMTRVTLEDTYGRQIVYDVDLSALTVRRNRVVRFDRRRFSPRTSTPQTVVPFNGSDCSWHDTHPDWLYGRSGNKTIVVYDFATGEMTRIVDLDTLGLNLPAESYTGGVVVNNNTLLTVCGGAVNDDHHWIVVGHLGTGQYQTLDTLTLTQFNNGKGFLVHATAMDLTARYVLMIPSAKSEVAGGHLFVWDREGNIVTEVTTAVSGHLAVGREAWVNQDVAPGTAWDAAQWTKRYFASPNEVANCIAPVLGPTEIYLGEHPSWTSGQSLADPFVTATYRYQPSDVPWRPWDEEVITINPSSGEVRRQAHHRSQVLSASGVWDFWATPRPNISPDGRWALFTSNWGRTLGFDPNEGADRQDAFLVELR